MSKQEEKDKKAQDEMKDSAHRIWLAGLGALSVAEEEGTKLFKNLVERGKDFETRGKVEADKMKDKAKAKAESAWEGVGNKVDEAVSGALHRLGVPTREEIQRLTKRVEELNHKIDMLRPRVTPADAPVNAPEEERSTRNSKGSAKVV
jgi:poly(hydroxyalkanoate) granule-associated protein